MSGRDIIANELRGFSHHAQDVATRILRALQEEGYRILGPGEIDRETLERAAEVAETYQRDASFDDSMVGAQEHNANQANIADAIRSLRGEAK